MPELSVEEMNIIPKGTSLILMRDYLSLLYLQILRTDIREWLIKLYLLVGNLTCQINALGT